MARKTKAQIAKEAAKQQAELAKAAQLSPEDCHNLRLLLNRVQIQGVDEAKVLSVLARKLEIQVQLAGGVKTEEPNGEDASPAAE